MVDIINVGALPNDGNGASLRDAANAVNAEFARLNAVVPVNITILNNLTLAMGVTVLENLASGQLIGALTGKSVSSVLDIIDDGGLQVEMDTAYNLRVGLRQASYVEGAITIKVRERLSDGVSFTERLSTIVIPVSQDASIVPGVPPNRFFRGTARGSGDGLSWANAKGISSLAADFAAAPANTVFGVLADDGIIDMPTSSNLIASAAGVKIIGMRTDYNPRFALFRGTRARWFRPTNPETVSNVNAVIVDGVVLNMRDGQANAGNNGFAFGGPLGGDIGFLGFMHFSTPMPIHSVGGSNWAIHDCITFNVARGISDVTGQAAAPTLTNSTIKRIRGIGCSKPWIRERGNSNAILHEDCVIDLRRIDGDSFGVGFSLDDRSNSSDPVLALEGAHNIQYVRCFAYNAHMTDLSTSYWNADGFSNERGNYDIDYIDCQAWGCTDGGWDFKGRNVRLIRCIAGDNKRNFRIWPEGVYMEDCESRAPRIRGGSGGSRHIWLSGGSAVGLRGADVLWKGGGMYDDGSPAGTPIDMSDQNGGNVLRLIDVDEATGVPLLSTVAGQTSVIMRAAAAPAGNPVLTSGTPSFAAIEGRFYSLPMEFDRPVTQKLTGGADVLQFTLAHIHNGPAQLIPQVYVPAGDNTRDVTVTVEDIARNPLVVNPTVTVAELVDARVLDLDFTTALAGSQTTVDSSSVPHAIVWGASTKVEQFAVGDNRLRLLGTTVGSAAFILALADSEDWTFDGSFRIQLDGLRTTELVATQVVMGHHAISTGNRCWNTRVEPDGSVGFSAWTSTSSSANFILNSAPGVIAANTDYDIVVLRVGGVVKILVNGVEVASAPFEAAIRNGASSLAIGGTASSNPLFKGWIKKIKLLKGKSA